MENDNLEKRLAELQAKYDGKFKDIEKETKDESDGIKDSSSGGVGGKFKIEITSKEERISILLPSITLDTRKIGVKIPSVKMSTKKIVWSLPKLVMVRRKIGERPEVVCKNVRNSFGIMGKECKMRYKPIYADVPETRNIKKEIKMDIPKIKMIFQELEIPSVEFGIIQQEIILTIPQFTFKDIEANVKKESEKLETKTEDKIRKVQSAFEAESTQIISDETTIIFDAQIDKLVLEKEKVHNLFQPLIDDLKNKIKSLRNSGAKKAVEELEDQLTELVKNYNESIVQITKAIEVLSLQREEIIDSL